MSLYGAGVEYGLHCLLCLVDPPEGVRPSSRDLAEFQGVSPAYIAKLFTQLEKAGLVSASEGVILAMGRTHVALSHVEQAAGQRVQTVECDRDCIGAVRRALSEQPFDEVLVSTRPPPGPKWLNPQPLRWLDELGVPVTAVVLGQRARLDRGVLKVRWDNSGP